MKRLFQAYKPLDLLGRGQYGVAVLLRSPTTGDMVVSKQISGIDGMGRNELEKVENERRILELMQHEHIISYFCSWYEAGTLHLVMEYAEGGTLADHISAQAAVHDHFPTVIVYQWLRQLSSALQHVHLHRVLHRDLKTQNVFLTSTGSVKLGDFGISKVSPVAIPRWGAMHAYTRSLRRHYPPALTSRTQCAARRTTYPLSS